MRSLTTSYYHRGATIPLSGQTLPQHFADIVKLFPNRQAIVSRHQHRNLNYTQLSSAIDEIARGLLGLGFRRGDRIGIWSTNNIEWLLVQMATVRIGAVLVCINPAYRREELAHALQRSELHALVTIPSFRSSDYVSMLTELVPQLKQEGKSLSATDFPCLRRVILFDPLDPEQTRPPQPGFTLWSELLEAAATVAQAGLDLLTADLDPDDPVGLLYTSGTFGFPKTAVLSHHNLLNNARFTAMRMYLDEQDRLCVPVPFYHCFGMVLANLLCLTTGACLILPDEYFNPLKVLQAVEVEQCTALHGVPTMFVAELEHQEFKDFDLSSLRTGIMAGAPCPPDLVRRVIEEMPCPDILIGYGMTEASPLTHLTAPEDPMEIRLETVGRNLPHQEVKIIDPESGKTKAIGQSGEICFRGYHIAKGYYGDEQATREAIDANGWLHSGDLGVMDEQGYVRITGRKKEIIIRGGENISPWQIEQCLLSHPQVAEVAVFGIPDDYFGEEIMAWIRLKPGQRSTEQELKDFCRNRIAHFKIPKQIRIVDEFPMTVSGKLQKYRMREIAITTLKNAKL